MICPIMSANMAVRCFEGKCAWYIQIIENNNEIWRCAVTQLALEINCNIMEHKNDTR